MRCRTAHARARATCSVCTRRGRGPHEAPGCRARRCAAAQTQSAVCCNRKHKILRASRAPALTRCYATLAAGFVRNAGVRVFSHLDAEDREPTMLAGGETATALLPFLTAPDALPHDRAGCA
jgi:hypothetical protein